MKWDSPEVLDLVRQEFWRIPPHLMVWPTVAFQSSLAIQSHSEVLLEIQSSVRGLCVAHTVYFGKYFHEVQLRQRRESLGLVGRR